MLFFNKKEKTSIQFRMIAIVITLTNITLAVFALYNYFNSKTMMTRELNEQSYNTVERLTKSLVIPLWDIEKLIADNSIQSEMKEKQIYAIIVRESERGTIFSGMKRDKDWKVEPIDEKGYEMMNKKSFLLKSGKIEKDGIKLGEVEIYVSNKFIKKSLNQAIYNTLFLIFCIDTLLILALFFCIKNFLNRPIFNALKGLQDGAHHMASAAEEAFSTSRTLSEKAAEQAASVQQTSASLIEMSSKSKKTLELTHSAEKLMHKNIKKSVKALNALEELNKKITHIESDNDQIGTIIKTIDEIAFQTNLLALNAAIEAAHAGKNGAGFSVVANEVRTLAKRASDAAQTTQILLDNTISRISEVTLSIKDVNTDFEAIIESARVVGEKAASVTEAGKDQAIKIDQISKAGSELDSSIQHIVGVATTSASASEQMSHQAHKMNNSVKNLKKLIGGKHSNKKRDAETNSYRTAGRIEYPIDDSIKELSNSSYH